MGLCLAISRWKNFLKRISRLTYLKHRYMKNMNLIPYFNTYFLANCVHKLLLMRNSGEAVISELFLYIFHISTLVKWRNCMLWHLTILHLQQICWKTMCLNTSKGNGSKVFTFHLFCSVTRRKGQHLRCAWCILNNFTNSNSPFLIPFPKIVKFLFLDIKRWRVKGDLYSFKRRHSMCYRLESIKKGYRHNTLAPKGV